MDNKQLEWDAKWIHGETLENNKNTYYNFRKIINIENIEETKIYISAESKYKLYINEQYVAYGSLQSQPYYKYFDVIDISQYLTAGRNIIAVHVYYLGTVEELVPGLLCQINDGKGNVLVATDHTWRVKRDKSRTQNTYCFKGNSATPYQEHYNASEDINWKSIEFDDRRWDDASVYRAFGSTYAHVAGPWSRLVPRDIPFMDIKEILPNDITMVKEHIGLLSRARRDDISINLSTKGKPIKYATVENARNILKEDEIAFFKTSTNHLDKIFDGYYNPSVILDFGKVITANIKIDITASAGQIIDIGYAERLIDGEFNNAIEGIFGDRYITKEGRQTFESYGWKGFRYVKILFKKCFDGVTVNNIKAAVTMYPYKERGMFNSSDELLNEVFDMCKYTIKICSNECITDTPHREQGQWLGDVAAVTLGAIYSCFGDVMLPEKFLKQSAANQMPTGLITNKTNNMSLDWGHVLPDYSLWWVMSVWNHYMYTGKSWVIHQNYPDVLKIMEAFVPYIDEYGMIKNMPYIVFIDWANIDKSGECGALNAIYYGAVKALLKIAEIRNDRYIIQRYDAIAKKIEKNYKSRFYNPALGVFSDSNVNGELSVMISEQTNASAIYFGLCDDDCINSIVKHIFVDKDIEYTESQPFYATFTLQALKKIGKMDLALAYIKDNWGKRMIGTGAKSCYEEWYQNGSWRSGNFDGFMRTNSHAWSAHPAEFLIKDLAGIEIVEAGCEKIRINPMKTEFDYTIVYPMPNGDVTVKWEKGELTITNNSSSQIIES